ncbi:MAG TPA: di-heme oxidoredictase family protein [Pyrinomonadaceae bacterium]|jgi:Tol biopolymer transport system component|nr:di-heme oxidoredictase family protein [Pyrinomonadaceae bacterium]
MKVLKLFVIGLFAAAFASALVQTRIAHSQSPTEAPAGFDNLTNNFEPQGTPVPPNTNPVPGDFESDKFIFDIFDKIEDGLGPVYNAQSCRECHQNPVSGGVTQIFELRAGHSAADGTFVDAPGGSLIHSRAINADIQERVPDGSRIICGKNSGTMFLMGFDGGQYGQVVNAPTGAMAGAAFSNDGRQYVFATADSTGSIQIFKQNVDGTGRTQLTSFSSASAFHPVWAPDGSKIAFASNASGNNQIWSMNPDGTGQTNLTNDGTLGGNDYPAWSPDSSKIAFQRLRNSATTNVWVMDANGANQTNLTGLTSFTFSGNPSYSPDGTQIAFQTNRDGNNEVYKMTSSGASQTRLTNNSANDGGPAWSPGGDIIAFHSTRSGGSSRIWIMKTDGTLPTLLVKQGFNSYSNPQWSPDTSGETTRSFRSSLNLLGDGFVEATDDSTFLAIQSAQPVGMRGTAIYVAALEAPSETRIGRFGHKDQLASLLSFSSDAYLNEMGITNRFNLVENSSLGRDVSAFDTVADNQPCDSDAANCGEDGEEDINAFARFMRSTKAPPRDRVLVPVDSTDAGSALFDTLSCSVCHTRNITTTSSASTSFNGGMFVVGALANKTFHPFGDFLLHDIGTGDGIAQAGGEATKNMIRTAPLWGVRTRDRLLHDGGSSSAPTNSGAQSFTINEAILRHAGQATSSRTAYQALSTIEKTQLIKFVKSL